MVGIKTADEAVLVEDKPTGTFRLLDLPPELQLQIFEFVVTEPEPIHVVVTTHQYLGKGNFISRHRLAKQPALAHVCCSFKSDVLKAYCKQNIFKIRTCGLLDAEATTHMAEWVRRLEPKARDTVRFLLVYGCDRKWIHKFSRIRMMHECTSGFEEGLDYDRISIVAAGGVCGEMGQERLASLALLCLIASRNRFRNLLLKLKDTMATGHELGFNWCSVCNRAIETIFKACGGLTLTQQVIGCGV